jgi:transposase-like protein
MDTNLQKTAVIEEYLLGNIGYRALSKKHGINRSTLNEWVLDFQGTPRSKCIRREKAKLQRMDEKKSEAEQSLLRLKVLALEQELEQERLHSKLLTAMIEVAEDDLKIPIRKKYGTKRLKK